MHKLIKSKITLMGISVTFIVAAFFLVTNNAFSNEGKSEKQLSISPEVQVENEKKSMEIENLLFGNSGIINQVNDELIAKGYLFQTLITASSVDNIQVIYVLYNKEATVSEQEVIKSIFFETLKKNNLDQETFGLKVADSDDGPDL